MSIIESHVQNCKPKLKEIKPKRSKRALTKSRSAENQSDSFDDSDSDQTWPLTLSLDQQSQEAHQILDTLKIVDPAGRRNIFKCKRRFFLENGDTAVQSDEFKYVFLKTFEDFGRIVIFSLFCRSKISLPLFCEIEGELGIDDGGLSRNVLSTLMDGYELQFEKLNKMLENGDQEFDAENRLFAAGIFSGSYLPLPTKIINAYIVFSRNRDFAARHFSRIRVRVGRKIGHSAKSSIQ